MSESVGGEGTGIYLEPPLDDRLLVKWLESQATEVQADNAQKFLNELLSKAAQPRHESGNGCIKLCYYLEQCKISKSSPIRDTAFSSANILTLFDFFIEWNEKNQNRSMRQVLELVSSLIATNPSREVALAVKSSVLKTTMAIIFHASAQPLVKPAFKSLECFLSKRTITPAALMEAFVAQNSHDKKSPIEPSWAAFFLEVFDWMTLPDTSPAAGKFCVTLFIAIERSQEPSPAGDSTEGAAWQHWIHDGLSRYPNSLESVKNHILSPLFKLDRTGSLAFLNQLNTRNDGTDANKKETGSDPLLHLAAIEVGKKSGLVEEANPLQFQKSSKKSAACVLLKEDTIGGLLSHSSDTVRSLAFSVLVSSSTPIRPYTVYAFELLQKSLGFLYSDTDAKFRNEVLSNTKHMIERLRGSTGFLVREAAGLKSKGLVDNVNPVTHSLQSTGLEELLASHIAFIEWYFDFLLQELVPTASYQRHITALKAIDLFLHTGILKREGSAQLQKADNDTIWPFSIDFFTPSSIRSLLDLLIDPFEDVRNAATAILKFASPVHFSKSTSDFQNLPQTTLFIQGKPEDSYTAKSSVADDVEHLGTVKHFTQIAEDASKLTGRADYADGVAHSYELLYFLEAKTSLRQNLLTKLVKELDTKISTAEKDLGRAVLEAPVHGTFAALCLVWIAISHATDFEVTGFEGFLPALEQRIVSLCLRIWKAVRNILCNDSPEGHIPHGLDGTDTVDTKDILSYSFRAIHESSNLLRTMVNRVSIGSGQAMSSDVFAQIGNLTFDQLSSLRHRGAFSTVSLTFARCCILTQLPRLDSKAILGKWYQGSLSCIFDQASTTRRSAGIPALLTGIMAANSKDLTFEHVIVELKTIAKRPVLRSDVDETNLPQVHAMNSLKETFKSSILGKRSESHIGDCLQIAVDSLESEIWAIRNCGLLLLRSLIDSLFGTNDNKTEIEAGWDGKSIKISYERYPTLPDLLVKLLGAKIDPRTNGQPVISAVESVFPALDIVRRAGPPSAHRNQIYKLVMKHLGSNVWNVREMAAHAICVLVPCGEWAASTKALLTIKAPSTNLRHGSLLAVRFILERQREMNTRNALAGLSEIFPSLLEAENYQNAMYCPEIATAYEEARNAAATILFFVLRTGDPPMSLWNLRYPLCKLHIYEDFFKCTGDVALSISWPSTCISLLRRAICKSFLMEDLVSLAPILEHAVEISTDVALAALSFLGECMIPLVAKTFLEVCQAYTSTIIASHSAEVKAAALQGLFDVLDLYKDYDTATYTKVLSMIASFSHSLKRPPMDSPALHNAEIQLSGWMLLASFSTFRSVLGINDKMKLLGINHNLNSWSVVLNSAGKKTEEFDTRYAAVLAIDSFYSKFHHFEDQPDRVCLISTLFALYDCLNDDDSEIRDIAAKTVSGLVSKSLIPLAARNALADTILRDCSSHPLLAINVVSRMTGSLDIAFDQDLDLQEPSLIFEKALNMNNTLFVEEDQNLFIDEVREAKFWSDFFTRLSMSPPAEPVRVHSSRNKRTTPKLDTSVAALLSWTLDSLQALVAIDKDDGVMGWISKPLAFSAAMRTLICARTLIDCHEKKTILLHGMRNVDIEEMVIMLEVFVAKSKNSGMHQSLLAELSKIQSKSVKERLGLGKDVSRLSLQSL